MDALSMDASSMDASSMEILMDSPLVISDWIKAAQTAGLIMSIDDFKELPRGISVRIVPLELSCVNLELYAARIKKPCEHVIYQPEEFFETLSNTFTRELSIDVTLVDVSTISQVSPVTTVLSPAQVMAARLSPANLVSNNDTEDPMDDDIVVKSQSDDKVIGMLSGVLGIEPYEECVYPVTAEWAATGSGDSYTRYIKWSNLNLLPPVFW